MNFFNDFKAINRVVIKKTALTLVNNIMIVPLLLIYVLAYRLAITFLTLTIGTLGSPGAFVAGLMGWMILCFVMSDFLIQLNDVLLGRKIKLKNLGSNYMTYFMPLLSATAIPNIVIMIFQILTRLPVHPFLLMAFYMLYATPEIVYQKDKDRLDIFVYGHQYIKENWKHWLIGNIFFALLFFFVFQNRTFWVIVPVEAVTARGRLFGDFFTLEFEIMKFWLVLVVPFVIMLIYRGFLFKILSVSSSRKREYMRNIYGK